MIANLAALVVVGAVAMAIGWVLGASYQTRLNRRADRSAPTELAPAVMHPPGPGPGTDFVRCGSGMVVAGVWPTLCDRPLGHVGWHTDHDVDGLDGAVQGSEVPGPGRPISWDDNGSWCK